MKRMKAYNHICVLASERSPYVVNPGEISVQTKHPVANQKNAVKSHIHILFTHNKIVERRLLMAWLGIVTVTMAMHDGEQDLWCMWLKIGCSFSGLFSSGLECRGFFHRVHRTHCRLKIMHEELVKQANRRCGSQVAVACCAPWLVLTPSWRHCEPKFGYASNLSRGTRSRALHNSVHTEIRDGSNPLSGHCSFSWVLTPYSLSFNDSHRLQHTNMSKVPDKVMQKLDILVIGTVTAYVTCPLLTTTTLFVSGSSFAHSHTESLARLPWPLSKIRGIWGRRFWFLLFLNLTRI